MITPSFCPDQWIAFIALAIFVFGSWLHHISKSTSVMGVQRYYNAYNTYYLNYFRSSFFIIPPQVFGIVWAILYPLIFVAIFIFYYYDDICFARSNNRFFDELTPSDDDDEAATAPFDGHYTKHHGVELGVWILFIFNIMINKMWDTAISMAQPRNGKSAKLDEKRQCLYSATVYSSLLTFFVFLSAAGLTVLTAIIAHGHPSKNLIIVPVFFGFYTLWTMIATVVSIRFSLKVDSLDLKD